MTSQDFDKLSRRDREILMDVVRTFILKGAPVSSRSVAKHEQHGVSAATIRNTMAELEEEGFLTQPHTSAGRVPTAAGYHFYIDSLQTGRACLQSMSAVHRGPPPGCHRAGRQCRFGGRTAALRALPPGRCGSDARHGRNRAQRSSSCRCHVRGCSAFWFRRAASSIRRWCRHGSGLPREELVRISNYLTENFAGLTLRRSAAGCCA